MDNFYRYTRNNDSTITLEGAGGMIGDMTKEAVAVATLNNCSVNFMFNKVCVNVSKHSDFGSVSSLALIAVQQGKSSVYGKGV